jgi:hypothetical protein
MTVVFISRFGRDADRRHSPNWRREELAELFRLYDVLRRLGLATGVEFGKTELNDPQFYLLGPGEEYPCILSVSRIRRGDHPWYVAEDGAGEVVAHGAALRAVVDVVVTVRSARRSVRYLRPVLGFLVCFRLASEQALTEFWATVHDAPLLDSLLELAA